ncbi:sialyltransferase [Chloropicon primus]|uniref:Sialyltransferase n=1 Tax=Chloropicon primus TaxID=1764295 RepID=A0A5B8MGS8_9CHLO|nr:sialyltransferase [Chloropicon primus]UPQ98845.1 sialyltransferase [Chloropicon primus]|mmetsp:Transcript_4878/g.14595  ORF Transcript_4878/g.14595 Transcript_4878/m.14595 type:complete len:417 (+) Transcript_4878:1638-2888(+)|eukprot:QDZ19633.1 sialyltransferase [Chloropicon primus]
MTGGDKGRIDARAEFMRAYLILGVLALLVVGAFVGTKWERPSSSSSSSSSSEVVEVETVAASSASLEVPKLRTEGPKAEASKRKAPKPPSPPAAEKKKKKANKVAKSQQEEVAAKPQQKAVAPHLDFSQPQHVCPGSPTTKGIKTGGPRQNKEVIYRILDKLGDGEVPETTTDMKVIKGGNFGFNKIECPFLTRDCADVRTHTGKQAAAQMKQSGPKWNETAQNFLDLKPGSLGSCALIGNSENMLKYNWGESIDAHDTVIRHNTPVGKYAKHVGSKATIIWVKGRYKGGGSAKASLAYLLPKNVNELPKNFKKDGKPILIRGIGAKPLDKTKRLLYYLQGANLRRKHPTGGYSRPLNIIASRLCTRVDLYGFGSRNSSGKYFKKSAKVRPAHMMAFEHWTFRYMMSKGKLCVYGE